MSHRKQALVIGALAFACFILCFVNRLMFLAGVGLGVSIWATTLYAKWSKMP